MNTTENKIPDVLNINKIGANQTKFYAVDHRQDWVKSLLLELNEKVEGRSEDEILANSKILINLEITKKPKGNYGNYLLVTGQFSAQYITHCVRTLEEMSDEVDFPINFCFVPGHLEQDNAFKDQTEVFEDNEMRELYFYHKGEVQLKEAIHEQIFLNINQYPVKDQEAPLVWAEPASDVKQ